MKISWVQLKMQQYHWCWANNSRMKVCPEMACWAVLLEASVIGDGCCHLVLSGALRLCSLLLRLHTCAFPYSGNCESGHYLPPALRNAFRLPSPFFPAHKPFPCLLSKAQLPAGSGTNCLQTKVIQYSCYKETSKLHTWLSSLPFISPSVICI